MITDDLGAGVNTRPAIHLLGSTIQHNPPDQSLWRLKSRWLNYIFFFQPDRHITCQYQRGQFLLFYIVVLFIGMQIIEESVCLSAETSRLRVCRPVPFGSLNNILSLAPWPNDPTFHNEKKLLIPGGTQLRAQTTTDCLFNQRLPEFPVSTLLLTITPTQLVFFK